MRILIADDDPTSREIARHLIAHAGHAVDTVCDGHAALDAILGGQYAVAILDLQMPGRDGPAVAAAARATLPAGRLPRLIAFTAAADSPADRALLALGFDACLPKPIRRAALAAVLDGMEPPMAPIAEPRSPAPAAALPALAGVVALLTAPAAPFDALRSVAAALKVDAIAAEQLVLAGLCARLETAASARDRPAVTELASAVVSMLG